MKYTGLKFYIMWYEFIRDFGDFLGGISLGYAIGMRNDPTADPFWYGVFGGILFLTSIYFRFYGRKKERQKILSDREQN